MKRRRAEPRTAVCHPWGPLPNCARSLQKEHSVKVVWHVSFTGDSHTLLSMPRDLVSPKIPLPFPSNFAVFYSESELGRVNCFSQLNEAEAAIYQF